MKIKKTFLLLLIPLLFASCIKNPDETEPYYTESEYVPILMKYDDILTSVVQMPARAISQPGKIYCFNEYIYIIEKYNGFHVINNSNHSFPVIVAFMSVPGCVDIAIKNDHAFVDNATDLVSIDISDKNNMTIAGRVPGIFPELLPPNNTYIPYWFNKENRPINTVIVGWRIKDEPL